MVFLKTSVVCISAVVTVQASRVGPRRTDVSDDISLVQTRMLNKEEKRDCSISLVDNDFEPIKINEFNSWEMLVKSEKTNCTMQKGDGTKKRVVVDYFGRNVNEDPSCTTFKVFGYTPNKGYSCEEALPGMLSKLKKVTAPDPNGASRFVNYKYSIPTKCKQEKCPLLINLRGIGATSSQCIEADQNCVDQQGVVQLIPNIDLEREGADSNSQGAGFCDMEDMEFMRSVVLDFIADHKESVDEKRVMLFGLSSGGTASWWGAVRSPDIYSHVFAVSPKSFWRTSKIEGCNHSGLLPQDDYQDFLDNTVPIWKNRSQGVYRKLKKLTVFIGTEDAKVDDEGDVKMETIPKMIESLGMTDSVKVELRVWPGLAHVIDTAAFNQGFDLMWKGKGTDDDGWSEGTVV